MESNVRPSGYSSPSIRARRRRLLEETRKLIEEQGLSGVSMDEVCKRAGVARRTLYNAFQSKERMIAIAINEYFEAYVTHIPYTTIPDTLERTVERMIIVASRNMAVKSYTKALMAIYHSPGADVDIWRTIHRIAADTHAPWIKRLEKLRQLQNWVDADELVDAVVRYRYATGNAWCQGVLSDTEWLSLLIRGFLMMMAGATRGSARRQIENMLSDERLGAALDQVRQFADGDYAALDFLSVGTVAEGA